MQVCATKTIRVEADGKSNCRGFENESTVGKKIPRDLIKFEVREQE